MNPTKEVKDALKQFADRLPSTEQVERAPRLGCELRKVYGDKLRQPDGKPLDPTTKYYIGDASCAVNHLKRLLRAYGAGGMAAVVKYLQPYEAFLGTPETEAAPEAPRAAEGFPDGRIDMNGGCVGCPLRCAGPNSCAGPSPEAEHAK